MQKDNHSRFVWVVLVWLQKAIGEYRSNDVLDGNVRKTLRLSKQEKLIIFNKSVPAHELKLFGRYDVGMLCVEVSCIQD